MNMDYKTSIRRRKKRPWRRRVNDDDNLYTFIGCYKHPRRQKEDFSLHIRKMAGVITTCFKRCKESVIGLQKETADDTDTRVGCYCFVDDQSAGNKVRSKRCNRKCNLTDDQSCGGHGKLTSVYSLPDWKPSDQLTTIANSNPPTSTSGRDIGLGVGITAVCSIVIAIVAVLLVRWYKRRRNAQISKSDGDETYDTIEYHEVGMAGGSDGSCHIRLLNNSYPNGNPESNTKARRQNTYLGHPRHTSEGSGKSELEKFLKPSEHDWEDEMGYMEPSTCSSAPVYLDIKGSPSESKPFPKKRDPTDDVPDIPLTHAPPLPDVNDIPVEQAPPIPSSEYVIKNTNESEATSSEKDACVDENKNIDHEETSPENPVISPEVNVSNNEHDTLLKEKQGTRDDYTFSISNKDHDKNVHDRQQNGNVSLDNNVDSASVSNKDKMCEDGEKSEMCTEDTNGISEEVTPDQSQSVNIHEAEIKSSEA